MLLLKSTSLTIGLTAALYETIESKLDATGKIVFREAGAESGVFFGYDSLFRVNEAIDLDSQLPSFIRIWAACVEWVRIGRRTSHPQT